METKVIFITGLKTLEQAAALKKDLLNIIGVYHTNVDVQNSSVQVTFETPANLNNIEKEIYDKGYTINF
ncbi:putative copper chaperone CsoZ [Staphylococcus durrellii]|uniref:putative copper chaperone CsoZ n=1 Tax=Staphylococcus durrellii TaxID=2781773 RepID=UPI00189C7FDD|nr:cation transporter [Staphylococcus durrellii]MBF7016594.1 cation transporter [Staphylococcus durrellii]